MRKLLLKVTSNQRASQSWHPIKDRGGSTLLDGSNVRLNWNIESDVNVHWIKFKNFLSLY